MVPGIVFEQPDPAGEFAFRFEPVEDDRGRETLRWHGNEDGRQVTCDAEPCVGNGTMLAVWLSRFIPVDWLL